MATMAKAGDEKALSDACHNNGIHDGATITGIALIWIALGLEEALAAIERLIAERQKNPF